MGRRQYLRFASFIFLLFASLAGTEQAQAQAGALRGKRVALVVGNGAYASGSELQNPTNDAADVAQALRRLGFQVIERLNAGKTEFHDAVELFEQELSGADVGLFFYAGHGMQLENTNYLIPVDAKIDTPYSLKANTISAQDVVKLMERDARSSLVLLDACRNNALSGGLTRTRGNTSRGLARMEASGNSLIGFAAQADAVAFDGNGQRNSPFTAALLRNIETPNVVVLQMLTEVTGEVQRATGNRQKPQVVSNLGTNVMLNETAVTPGERTRPAATNIPPALLPTPSPAPACVTATGPSYRVIGVRSDDVLNMREGPSAGSGIVYAIPFQARGVRRGACTNNGSDRWCEVSYDCRAGWVNMRYLTAESTASLPNDAGSPPSGNRVIDVSSDDKLYIRPAPGDTSREIGSIPYNGVGIQKITCQARGNSTWCQVRYGSTVGWVNARYLD